MIEIISSIFSDHNTMKLEIMKRKIETEKKKHMDTKQATKVINGSMMKSKKKSEHILR